MGRGRPSRLADDEFAQRIAALYVDGMALVDIAAEVEAERTTVSAWVRDPRVTVHIDVLSKRRKERMAGQIDAELLRRVLDPAILRDMDTELVLKLRKELLGRERDTPEENEAGVTSGLWDLFDENPELAEQFQKATQPRKGT